MKDSNINSKFDAPLRMKLEEVNQAQESTILKCFIKCEGSIDGVKRKVLEEAGIRILTVAKDIATVEGTFAAIRQAAGYNFVRSISLSQTRYPLDK